MTNKLPIHSQPHSVRLRLRPVRYPDVLADIEAETTRRAAELTHLKPTSVSFWATAKLGMWGYRK